MIQNAKVTQSSSAYQITKSNDLSLARLNDGLTLQQIQLLSYIILCTQKQGANSFRKADFEKCFGMEQYKTKAAREDVMRLMRLSIAYNDIKADEFGFINLFTKITYARGLLSFHWTPDILPHIVALQERFITLDLHITAKFTSNFSWRLYEFLKAKHGFHRIDITKVDLMEFFNVHHRASYASNTRRFMDKVLDRAIYDINMFTEYQVSYEPICEGRKIVAFRLQWTKGMVQRVVTENQIETLQANLHQIIGELAQVFELPMKKQSLGLPIIQQLKALQEELNANPTYTPQEYKDKQGEISDVISAYNRLFTT